MAQAALVNPQFSGLDAKAAMNIDMHMYKAI